MDQALNNIKHPQWWLYSDTAWQQLIDLLISLDISQFENVFQQDNWLLVSGGVTNFNYRLIIAENVFFVQVIDAEKLQRLPTQKFVPSNQVMEKHQQLNNWLVHCFFESKELRVFKWIDAKNTSLEILNQNNFKTELVDFLSVLHSKISVLPILDIHQHLDHYYHLAIKRNPEKGVLFESVYNRAKICAKSFSPSKNCHNDLSPGNVLYRQSEVQLKSPSQLIIVDWEYACISDPFFDIAGICVNFDFDQAQEDELIQNYSEKMAIYSNLKKYNDLKELYQLVNQLWRA